MGPRILLAFVIGLMAAGSVCSQVEIRSPRWGFDGRAVVGEFNLLTVQLHNPDEKQFRGVVSLRLLSPMGGAGAPHQVACFLAPGTTRTVQFFPYVLSSMESWRISAGRARHTFSGFEDSADGRTRLEVGDRATVVLVSPDALSHPAVGLPTFLEDAFPASVTGTGGLRRVLLDHAPRWQRGQWQAFLDWIRGGGELHLFHEGSEFPALEGELGGFRALTGSHPLGAGRVVLHEERLAMGWKERFAPQHASDVRRRDYSAAGGMLSDLRMLVRPDHNWPLIYLVLGVFFVAVVPVHAWLSIRRVGYLASIGLLLAMVSVCTFVLFQIGRRGYDETSGVHSLSYARELSPGRFDVIQFKNLFSTTSAELLLRHKARGSIYTPATAEESVPGRIFAGAEARFQVVVPLFTSRSFVHRGVFQAPPIPADIVIWPETGSLVGLELEWRGPPVLVGVAIRKDRATLLQSRGDRLVGSGPQRSYANLLREWNQVGLTLQAGVEAQWSDPEAKMDLRDLVRRNFEPVVAQRLHSEEWVASGANDLTDADSIMVLVLCEAPEPLALEGAGTVAPKEQGYVIYQWIRRKSE